MWNNLNLKPGELVAGSEQEKLADRNERAGVKYTHVSWGPEGFALDDEARAKVLIDILDKDAEDAKIRVSIRLSELKSIYKSIIRIEKLCQVNVADWLDGKYSQDVLDLKCEIRSGLDMLCLTVGQNLPRKVYEEARKELGE